MNPMKERPMKVDLVDYRVARDVRQIISLLLKERMHILIFPQEVAVHVKFLAWRISVLKP
jgi:hypothetical protein